MRAVASSFAVGAVLASVALSAPAQANGRFPESQRLLEHPSDPNRLYLAATYGLLVTEDRGKTWYSICEQALSSVLSVDADPLLEVLADGTMVSGIYTGLRVSSDCGCGWTAASPGGTISDLAVDRNGHLLVTVREVTNNVGRARVHQSTDGGKTWTLLAALPEAINDAYTVDVAPSDPNRVYVTAITQNADNPAVLLASKDRGKTWTQTEIPGTNGVIQPFIAAVHPTNADLIFVRTDDWEAVGDFAAEDALLQSADGGKTWTEVLRKNAKLFGFALSPDGSTVLAGYGDPVQAGGRTSNAEDFGIYKGSAGQSTPFERIYSAAISCLRWTGQGLYACMVQNHPDLPSPGMSLGFSPSVSFTMATPNPFTSLLDIKKVKGPLGCGGLCTQYWNMPPPGGAGAALCEQLEAPCSVDATKNVLTCAGAATGTGGASGAGGAGGGRDGGTGGSTGGSGGGGCGCAVSPPTVGSRLALLATLASLLLPLAWRRRRCQVTLVSMVRGRGARRLMVLALLTAGAMSSGACGAGGDPSPDIGAVFNNCEDRGEDFFPGIAKTSADGVTMAIIAAVPEPPANTDDNDWTVKLTDAAGAPLLGANLVVAPFMVDHGHGAPNVIALEEGDGNYHLAPVYLKMTGLWQVTLKATPTDGPASGQESRVMFPFCIPPR